MQILAAYRSGDSFFIKKKSKKNNSFVNIIDVVGYTFEIFIADAREGSEMQIG